VIVQDILAQKEWRILKGVNRFLQELSDMCSDSPSLPQWFWNLVLKPMLTQSKFEVKQLKWHYADEEEIFSLGGHFQLLALLIKWTQDERKGGNLQAALDSVKIDLDK